MSEVSMTAATDDEGTVIFGAFGGNIGALRRHLLLLLAGGVGRTSEPERQLLGRLRAHDHFQLSVHLVRDDQRNVSFADRVSVNKNLVTGIEALETKRALARPVSALV